MIILVVETERDDMKKLLFFTFLCGSFVSWLAAYRLDLWTGSKSDRAVQKAGYAYYICDPKAPRKSRCYAVMLTDQEKSDVLQKLSIHRGKAIEDALESTMNAYEIPEFP